MKVRLGTIDVDDDTRRAINAHYGKKGMATRADVRSFALSAVRGEVDNVLDDHEAQLVNEPIKRVKCRACGAALIEPVPRPGVEWTPVRSWFPVRGGRGTRDTKPGPHPADAPACGDCYPAAYTAEESPARGGA